MLDEKEIRRRLRLIQERFEHTHPEYPYYLGLMRAYRDVLEVDEDGRAYIKIIDELLQLIT